MIHFDNINEDLPYLLFKREYENALSKGQKSIEALSISSFNNITKEVDSRFVNLKFIKDHEFIFFSNYESPKALSFSSHNQISALIFWSSINVQIRMKAKIKKTPNDFNQKYFFQRSIEKNALAISSKQSKPIGSYDEIKENYYESLKNDDLKKCPDFWGGYSFTPYYFEFWEGHKSRLNKREVFERIDDGWKHLFLQP